MALMDVKFNFCGNGLLRGWWDWVWVFFLRRSPRPRPEDVDDDGSGTIGYEEFLKMMTHKILNRDPKDEPWR